MTKEEYKNWVQQINDKVKNDWIKKFQAYIEGGSIMHMSCSPYIKLFTLLFDKIPTCYTFKNSDELFFKCLMNDFSLSDYDMINFSKTTEQILEEYKDESYIIFNTIIITPQFIYGMDMSFILVDDSTIDIERLKKCVVPKNESKYYIHYVTMGKDGIDSTALEVFSKVNDDNVEKLYNDIDSVEKTVDFIKSDDSGIVILHGEPGCGKTSLIRYMMTKVDKKTKFFWIDKSMFNYLNDTRFIQFLMNNKESVFVLEDCESIIKSREIQNNELMSMLLNISDGILADALKDKFILTYNTKTENVVDSALLRNGRMKADIEIKKLNIEKTTQLLNENGVNTTNKNIEPMSLADIFNSHDENINISSNNKLNKKIGFNN